MIENSMSPFIALVGGWVLCYYYPSLKKWSTARGDTTIIIGTVVGFSVGSFLNNSFGFLHRPDEPPLYEIMFPSMLGYVLGVVRTTLGLLCMLATRQALKASLLRLLCYMNDMDYKDPTYKKEQKIELPYNYITYFFIGLNISFVSPLMFRMLNIERDYSFTEL
jgi:sphingosine-1-phosphate phosphatase 1